MSVSGVSRSGGVQCWWCIRRALLGVDQVGDLEVEGKVWLEVLRVARLHCHTISLELSQSTPAESVRMKRCSGEVGASPNAP
jgi:hypothetical protein